MPSGTLSSKITRTSKLYDGTKSDYWIYVPAQYRPEIPAAVMVFQDGEWYTDRNSNNPALNVIDNLIAQKENSRNRLYFYKPRRYHRFTRHADLQLCECVLSEMEADFEGFDA